jgi:hypothetical protein
MNETLTLASLGQIIILLGAILTLWWRVETRVSSGAVEANKKADDVLTELNAFKLMVAENYAKNGFLKDVEARLLLRFDGIVAELHGMRGDFQEVIVKMAVSPRRRS